MYEELDDKNSRQRVLGVSIAFVPGDSRHVAQIAVPLGVRLSEGAVIKTDSYTSPKMPFRRCDRDGCYVELVLPQEMIDAMAKSGPQASMNIVADNGRSFALRFSLNGFAGAHDAMSALARQKASAPGAPAAAPAKKR
jgi:invasion protein IalB